MNYSSKFFDAFPKIIVACDEVDDDGKRWCLQHDQRTLRTVLKRSAETVPEIDRDLSALFFDGIRPTVCMGTICVDETAKPLHCYGGYSVTRHRCSRANNSFTKSPKEEQKRSSFVRI